MNSKINFMSGDLLKSSADTLVNTVNCEGVMGKGLAYQFKKKYPDMANNYIAFCKSGKLHVGTLHYYQEKNVLIVNFPTKKKWREKSKLSYIDDGLLALKKLIIKKDIKHIAIPPLGSGNGGLNWNEVKIRIIKSMENLPTNTKIDVYEPVKKVSRLKTEPPVTYELIYILELSLLIKDFTYKKLKDSLELTYLLTDSRLLKKSTDNYVRSIRQLKKFYLTSSNKKLYDILLSKLSSDNMHKMKKKYLVVQKKIVNLINSYNSEELAELIHTLSLIKKNQYKDPSIKHKYLDILISQSIISENLLSYDINHFY